MLTRTADEWEVFFQSRHVPAGRVRRMEETLADPHLAHRAVLHRHESSTGVGGGYSVPLAAFKLAHGSARIDSPPPTLGRDTDAVLGEAGYSMDEITSLRDAGIL